jgi:hypothetical protein
VCIGAITTEDVALFPRESAAVTANVPLVVPAVYRPPLLMLPPVADQVTEELALSVAVNCCTPPEKRLVETGFRAKVATIICDAVVKTTPVDASSAWTSSR